MFICYLDDSDDDQSSVSTLAGYVTQLDRWEHYEEHATKVYDKFGVNILSAKDMHNGRKEFKNWTWSKKWSFIDQLFAGAKLQWGVSHSVSKKAFVSMKPHRGIGPNMSRLGLAMAATMHTLLRGNPLAGLIQAKKLSFVVETGHRNNADIERYFNFAKEVETYKGFLGDLRFLGKTDAKALHLADILAFYSRRQHSLEVAHAKSLIVPKSREMKALLRQNVPLIMKVADKDNLQPLADPTEGDSLWWSVPISSRPSEG